MWLWVSGYRLYFVPPLSGAGLAVGNAIGLCFASMRITNPIYLNFGMPFGTSRRAEQSSLSFHHNKTATKLHRCHSDKGGIYTCCNQTCGSKVAIFEKLGVQRWTLRRPRSWDLVRYHYYPPRSSTTPPMEGNSRVQRLHATQQTAAKHSPPLEGSGVGFYTHKKAVWWLLWKYDWVGKTAAKLSPQATPSRLYCTELTSLLLQLLLKYYDCQV